MAKTTTMVEPGHRNPANRPDPIRSTHLNSLKIH